MLRSPSFAHPRLSAALAALQLIEARLGTDHEQPDDLERARELAHTLRNLLCLETLDGTPTPEPIERLLLDIESSAA